ncbi:MAG: nucleotidyltransferase domain-containing protein [Acidimicrobiia bacterium]
MGTLEVVDPRYEALLDRATRVLSADPRVVDVRVSGSIASGDADEWSDLDLQIVATPDSYQEFVADWPSWLAAITPTVFARTPIAPFILNTVTDDGLTFDLAIHDRPLSPFTPSTYVVGMLTHQGFQDLGLALEYAVAEQLRGLVGPFISLLQRGEHLRHLTGIAHIVGLLTTVFTAELGAPPPGKRWNRTFTAEQLDVVAALPPLRATYDGIAGFGLGLAEVLVTRARPLYPRYELEWPSALAAVTAARLQDTLGVDTSAWLS